MELQQLGQVTRRRIGIRLLPFVFLMYVISYVDRVNVSFANLRMSADLGFSDRIFGLGAGIFFVGYVLFEIPGAVIVERWSARKWMARIMISWGLVTIITAFVRTAHQFYAARFLLGVAEASFFPGNDCVSDTLVPALRQSQGHRFVVRGSSRGFCAWFCTCRLATCDSLVWHCRLALVVHCRGHSPGNLGRRHIVLSNGQASGSSLALGSRT